MRYRTYELNEGGALTLSGSDQALALSGVSGFGAGKQNLVSFHFELSSAGGDNVTITPQEYYEYSEADVNEIYTAGAGWGNIASDDGTGVLTKEQYTADGASAINNFSVHISTNAQNVRVLLQGQGTVKVWVTVSEVS